MVSVDGVPGPTEAVTDVTKRTLPAAICALVVLIAVGCGGSDQSSDVKGVVWRWTATLHGLDSSMGVSAVPGIGNYLLTLGEDGTFSAKADCNILGGTYSMFGSDLTLQPGPMTNIACGKDSQSDEYVALLKRVATWEIYGDGQLALALQNDAGYMYFSAA